MSFLLFPMQQVDEGPSGYQHRLATENLISFGDVTTLNFAHKTSFNTSFLCAEPGPQIYVKRRARCCPMCLQTRGIWDIGWELLFADACVHCGHRLVDECPTCGAPVTWARGSLTSCDCGQNLSSIRTAMAPESIISLSRLLRTKVLGSNVEADCVLNPLSLEQVVRLVRLLGSYANAEKNLRPQKILNVDQLKVSWSITSSAADLLSSWPLNFIDFLNRLRERHSDVSIGQLPKVFGGFYHALYRRFKEPEFQFLRSAFEAYVIEHWTGGLAKRNRRLEVSALANAAWIPANHACATLGVSRRRLKDLIREGTLSGEVRKTSGQREFIVVRKSEVQAKALEVDTGLPMKFTANRLGLKRARLQKLLPLMCPDAVKIGDQGCPWSIPLHWVETWERLIGSYDVASSAECSFISIAHVLRYWPWKDDQVAAFLNLVYSGSIKSAGRAHGVVGIGGLLFETAVLLDWHSSQYSNVTSELTVPEVAAHLEVKQEVAYSLVRSGKIASSVQFRGRRSEHMVTSETLEHFKRDFVLCRDVAKKLNTSPRAVLASLRSAQVAPVAGPGVDDCRQFFFHRTDVESFMDQ